uniref:Uncharacterized protein n=1 Tax=Bracon brevicornis TaxID=1563983 RepID=A0A6V7LVB0_9HYME
MAKFRVKYQPQSLCQLLKLQISKQHWTSFGTKELMKRKLRKYNEDLEEQQRKHNKEVFESYIWKGTWERVHNNLDHFCLPLDCLQELKTVAKNMGQVFCEWIYDMYSKTSHSFVQACLDHIRWTKDGVIDSVETLKSVYYSTYGANGSWHHLHLKLLYEYCLEECIIDHYEKDKDFLERYEIARYRESTILPIYWIRRMQNRLESFYLGFKHYLQRVNLSNFSYDNTESLDYNLAYYFITIDKHFAAVYFYGLLSKHEKIRIITDLVEDNVQIPNETAVYLWKQALFFGIDAYTDKILKYASVLMYLRHWPQVDLLTNFFERLAKFDLDRAISLFENINFFHSFIISKCNT